MRLLDDVQSDAEELDRESMVRLDLNEAPFGPPPGARERLQEAAEWVHVYPISSAKKAAAAAANYYKVSTEQVILTAGVDEAVDLCMLVLGDIYSCTPGFNGFADRAHALGKRCHPFSLTSDFEIPQKVIDEIGEGDLVMLANPNNPTGHCFKDDQLLAILARSAYLLLDETYADFAYRAPGLEWLAINSKLIVFRSFSKSFGLGGLRIGCLVGDAELIARLQTHQAFYTIDRFALEGLIGALERDPGYPMSLANRLRPLRRDLVLRLTELDLFAQVFNTETNFVLATCRLPEESHNIQEWLVRRASILVTETEVFGLPNSLRISVGRSEDHDRLIEALAAWRDRIL